MRRPLYAFLALALCGCGTSTTETGYEPNRLGMGDAQRRGLYAPKYSAEHAQAQAEKGKESQRRTGSMGIGGI